MINDLDINILRRECNNGRIEWTTHVLKRMQERNIAPSDIRYCINHGEIIEQYPQAYPYPACLIFGIAVNDTCIHVVVGYGKGKIWIISAYIPNENEWVNGFKARKE